MQTVPVVFFSKIGCTIRSYQTHIEIQGKVAGDFPKSMCPQKLLSTTIPAEVAPLARDPGGIHSLNRVPSLTLEARPGAVELNNTIIQMYETKSQPGKVNKGPKIAKDTWPKIYVF